MVKGLSRVMADEIVARRQVARYRDVQDLVHRCGIDRKNLSSLAEANSLLQICGDRHRAYWESAGVEQPGDLVGASVFNEAEPMLPKPGEWDETLADYASTRLTLGRHPVAQLRSRLDRAGILAAMDLATQQDGKMVSVTGLVINRQRPMTASGVVFITLEDETGQANIVIWPKIVEKQRKALMKSRLITVTGKLQIESHVVHVIANQLLNCNYLIAGLSTRSRDFH